MTLPNINPDTLGIYHDKVPPAPPHHTRIYMLVRSIAAKKPLNVVKTTYSVGTNETPLDPDYTWSDATSTPTAKVWAGVSRSSGGACEILAYDLQIGDHFRNIIMKEAFKAYTALSHCKAGSFSWGDGACNYKDGMNGVNADIAVEGYPGGDATDSRIVDWDVVHVDVPTPQRGTNGLV